MSLSLLARCVGSTSRLIPAQAENNWSARLASKELLLRKPRLPGDSKLILSGSKVATTRSKPFETDSDPAPRKPRRLKDSLTPLLLLIGTGGVAFLLWRNELTGLANGLAERATTGSTKPVVSNQFQSPHPVPSNVSWSLNLTNATIPSDQVVGRIHGHGFLCERATFKAEARLSILRQGIVRSRRIWGLLFRCLRGKRKS